MIEIIPIRKLDAAISVPGSKYLANRVLMMAALAGGVSTIKNVPDNDDINQVVSVLRELGVKIEKKYPFTLTVHGKGGKFQPQSTALEVKESGTLLRFLTALSSLIPGKITITGSKRIQERPMKDLLNSLQDLGIKCWTTENGYPPLEIHGGILNGGTTSIRGNVSSQFISALLLAAPYAQKEVKIQIASELVSIEYVDMTIELMGRFGVQVCREGSAFIIKSGQRYLAQECSLPADWSSASYFLAAAAITSGKVMVINVDFNACQGEKQFAELLERMGCKVIRGKDWITVEGTEELRAIEVNLKDMPDVVQTLAAVAAYAQGTTRITGIEHLRYKECDRLEKTAQELSKAGVEVTATEHELQITGSRELKAAVFETHNDHRMAMSLALLGLKTPGIKIQNPEVARKSFPDYWEKLKELGAKILGSDSIIIIGYRGVGKTTIAKILAEKLSRKVTSTDEEMVKRVGNMTEFVRLQGWEKFREIESEVIQNITLEKGIIDCGGGVVEKERNMAELKKRGTVIWLKATASTIRERISDSERPALTSKSLEEEVDEVLERRKPLYQKAADFEITAENKSSEQVAEEIITLLGLKPRLCVPIVAETVEEAKRDLADAEKSADIVELRLDYIKKISESELMEPLAARTKPLIVTLRGERRGKKELLLQAVEAGAEFIDLDESEKSLMEEVRKKGRARIILSFHDFEQTPSSEELNRRYEEMKRHQPDFIKIVTMANSINDNFTIFKFLQGKKNCAAFCLGVYGTSSRIAAPKYGSLLTFSSLREGKASAPGQLTIAEMKKYDIATINQETEIYGVIGAAAEHSHSPLVHHAFFRQDAQNARFLPFKVEEKELKEFVHNLRKFNFLGAAVTMPHKVSIMPYLDEVAETAAKIGAVNTIVNQNGKLVGYNTDSYGALRALQEKTALKDKKVLVLGAGGAARAIVYGLQQERARVTICNRTLEKVQKVAEEFQIKSISITEAEEKAAEYDIIINATSVGMSPNQEETPLSNIPQGKVVMDIISHPTITKFIKLAQKNECTVITGEKMLLHQAVQQYRLWKDQEPSHEGIENAWKLLRGML